MNDELLTSDKQDSVRGSVAAAGAGDSRNPAGTAMQDLATSVECLRSAQADFVDAEIRHLRELAMLNRFSDGLALRRTHAQVLDEAVREVAALAGTQTLWLLEPDGGGRIGDVRDGQGRRADPATLPTEAADLFDRIVRERPSRPLTLPTYDPQAPEGLFMGMTVATSEHLMEVLVLHYTDLTAAGNSEQHRLLQSLMRQTAIACENAKLFESIGAMIVDVVVAMALAIESRDPYTGGHVQRVTGYALCLAERAGVDPIGMAKLRLGGILHDIGKVAVPDAVLRKCGKLDPDEYAIMKAQATVGHQIISPIPQLAPVASIIRHHHERWDGRGYPDGLSGTSIDPLARLTAIADTFDAMTSDRPYRKGLDFAVARAEIQRCSGAQFEPEGAAMLEQIADAELIASAQRTQDWCGGNRQTSARDFLGFLDLDRPKVA